MPLQGKNSSADFTVDQYREIVSLAKGRYRFVGFGDLPASDRFVLWRHDCDFSLNRALRLAEVEHELGVKCSYFLLPHSEFYNVLELSQTRIVQRIAALGHEIGLHLDLDYHNVRTEAELELAIARDAGLLRTWLGIEPVAFSFHNPGPSAFARPCEAEHYGGLINTYSASLKRSVSYVSDSNGIWRFRRLRDVVEAGEEPQLHVLTHPEWWQETPQPARQRVFRCVQGRAKATMQFYDAILESHGRANASGPAECLQVLRQVAPERYDLCDYLWHTGEFATLFLELFQVAQARTRQHGREWPADGWLRLAHQLVAAQPVEMDVLKRECVRLCGFLDGGTAPEGASGGDSW